MAGDRRSIDALNDLGAGRPAPWGRRPGVVPLSELQVGILRLLAAA